MSAVPHLETLRCAAALSRQPDTAAAIAEVCSAAAEQLGGKPDLAVVFVSHHHAEHFENLAERICAALACQCLIGCSGESIVGGGQEIEGQPALSLWTARLPGVSLRTMHLQFERTPEGGTFVGWPDDFDELPADASLLLLGEPYSFPADVLLARLREDRPGMTVLGGMASGGGPGDNRVFLGGQMLERGAAALVISGPVRIRSIVSQGCRPIGRPMVITKAERNIIQELSGKPAFKQLGELWETLDHDDQRLVQSGLHVGLVINEYQDHFARGDFLVRNVIGADPEQGVIAIGDYVRIGQTMQFHVRDAETADDDLRALLATAHDTSSTPPVGALLFTCNGRGTRLFDDPHHDAAAIAGAWASLPVAGFFAQGEIGPVGGQNFLHGFTASVALFEPVERIDS